MSGVHKIEIKDIVHNVYYQNNSSLFLELVQLINQNPYRYVTKITSKCSKKSYKDYSYMRHWIDQMVPQLSNYNYATKCYWIIYGITTFPKCKNENCSHLIDKQISFWQGIKQYCSVHCQITSREFKEQRKETWKRNLGVEYPTQSKQVIQLRQMNNLIKYNVTEPSKLPNVIKKKDYLQNRRKMMENMFLKKLFRILRKQIFNYMDMYVLFIVKRMKKIYMINGQKNIEVAIHYQIQLLEKKVKKNVYRNMGAKIILNLKNIMIFGKMKNGRIDLYLNKQLQRKRIIHFIFLEKKLKLMIF